MHLIINTLSRTPLDEGSAPRRGVYLHDTQQSQEANTAAADLRLRLIRSYNHTMYQINPEVSNSNDLSVGLSYNIHYHKRKISGPGTARYNKRQCKRSDSYLSRRCGCRSFPVTIMRQPYWPSSSGVRRIAT